MTGPDQEDPADPSMEDILASIRRILSEEEKRVAEPSKPPGGNDDDVLVLGPSMMVADSAAPEPEPPEPTTENAADETVSKTNLVAPETARAAAASVAGLVAALVSERTTQVHRTGPTIEDLVRAELRPLLKEWLDAHLPPMVERLARIELERVMGRALP